MKHNPTIDVVGAPMAEENRMGDNVRVFLSAIIALAEAGEASVLGIEFSMASTRDRELYRSVSDHPTELNVRISCEKFPAIGQAYGYSAEDERAFAEKMMEFWTRRVEHLGALTTAEKR